MMGARVRVRGEPYEGLKTLAQTIIRELRENGYTPREIVGLSSELIGLITTEIRIESITPAALRPG